MAEMKLHFCSRISRRVSHDMILCFAKHGNHFHETHFRTDADVKQAFAANGVEFDRLVEHCRDYQQQVPFFENLVGSTATITDGKATAIDLETGKEGITVQGPGEIALYSYWAIFETAIKARDRAVEESSYGDFLTAVTHGISSIEGYLSYRAEYWNDRNPNDQLIDSAQDKVSFDDKLNNWIPKMSGGRKLDKSGINWQHYKTLRGVRDNQAIHRKSSSYGSSLSDIADGANKFRTGVAGLLFDLHILFKDRVPSVIIRAMYAPNVEVMELN